MLLVLAKNMPGDKLIKYILLASTLVARPSPTAFYPASQTVLCCFLRKNMEKQLSNPKIPTLVTPGWPEAPGRVVVQGWNGGAQTFTLPLVQLTCWCYSPVR